MNNFKPHHRRRKSGNFNPLDLQINDDMDKVNVIEYDEDSVRLVDNLQSYDSNTRELATIALSQLNFDNEEVVKGIIDQGVIKLLVERLVDANHQIVFNSLHALLALSESTIKIEGEDLAFRVFNSGVLTVLDGLINGAEKSLIEQQNQDAAKSLKVQITIIEYAYKLVATLAETIDEKHLPTIIKTKLTNESTVLFLSLNSNEILTGIASYWHVLTETSLDVCKKFAESNELLKRAITLLDSNTSSAELKAYISAMLFNIISKLDSESIVVPNREELGRKVLDTIFNTTSIHILDEINNLVKICNVNAGQKVDNQKSRKDELTEELGPMGEDNNTILGKEGTHEENQTFESPASNIHLKEAIKIWQDSATAIEICLGVLINIFEANDEDEQFQDLDDDLSDEEEFKENVGSNKNGPNGTSMIQNTSSFFEKLVPGDAKERLIVNLLDKCKHMSQEHHTFLTFFNLQRIVLQANRIVEFAFSTLMNLCNNYIYKQPTTGESLNVVKFSADLATFLWSEFKFYLELIYSQALNLKESNVETGVATKNQKAMSEELDHEKVQVNEIIKFLILVLSKSSSEVAACVPMNEILHVKNVLFSTLDQQTKLYLIELIAIKASPKNQMTVEDNAVVADILIDLLKVDDVMIIGETLNSLFDIYADVEYDTVFKAKNFLGMLEYGYDVFREKIKTSRKNLSQDDLSMLRQHLQNLKRFIKYKKDSFA